MEIWDVITDWGEAIYIYFAAFGFGSTRPLFPEAIFPKWLKTILSVFDPVAWVFDLMGFNYIWDASLLDFLVIGAFGVVIYSFIKWILDVAL